MIPVMVLAYNRPDKLRAVLTAVHAARPTRLLVAVDGPRAGNEEAVGAVRRVVDEFDWDCPVQRLFFEENKGVRNAMTAALDAIFETVPFAAILEDDCFPAPDFFRFVSEMGSALQSRQTVGMVTGTNFLQRFGASEEVLFSEGHIWGWATWADRWREYRMGEWEIDERAVRRYYGVGWPYRRMLIRKARAGVFDSWAIPWLQYLASRGLLCAIPPVNLVTNVGHGGGGTHTSGRSRYADLQLFALGPVLALPETVVMNRGYQRRYALGLQMEHVLHTSRRPLVALARRVAGLLRARVASRSSQGGPR